jgi:membrane-associated phospholipid phosphatase
MVGGFAGIAGALGLSAVRDVDLRIRDLADAHRPYAADLIAQTANRLGSGGVLTAVCLVLAAYIGVRTRSWWPFAPVVAAFLLTGVVIEPLKLLLDRPAPHAPLPDDVAVRLFARPDSEMLGAATSLDAMSFPSGHAVNTVVWYGVVALLLAPWLSRRANVWLRVTPPVVVTVAGTYLGYHWLTDMLAGLALGVPLAHAVTAIRWPTARRLAPEPDGRRARS